MTKLLLFWLLLISTNIYSQEIILKTNFTVRDFKIIDNTILYIEKREIKSYNLKTKTNDTLFKNNSFFIGGYGLKIFHSKQQNEVITASNELVRNISSIRFYDIIKKDINKFHVLYDNELMDFFVEPKDSIFLLSKKDSTIVMYNYGGVPRYKKIDSLKTGSYARKIEVFKRNVFYITDLGKVFQYNMQTKTNKLLYQGGNLLVSFIFDKKHENIYVTSFDGKIIKINLNNKSTEEVLNFGSNIIETIAIFEDKYLIAGDWSGLLKIIDINTYEVKKTYNNKKRIVKIIVKGDSFYTSSSDKTIKKWKIDK